MCTQVLGYGTFAPIWILKHEVQDSKYALLCFELPINFLLLHSKLPSTEWIKKNHKLSHSFRGSGIGHGVTFPAYLFHEGILLATNPVFCTHLSLT